MKFTVQQEDLVKVLNVINKMTSKLTQGIILNNVAIIKADDKHIDIIGANANEQLEYTIEANNIDGDGILYNVADLTAIVNKLSGTLYFDDGKIKNAKSNFKIGFIDYKNNYPEFNFICSSDNQERWLDKDLFIDKLSKTSYASASNGVISGILLNQDEIVATDGNRLIINKFDSKFDSFIFPAYVLEYIKGLFVGEQIAIAMDDKRIYISDNNGVLVAPAICGNYPKYKQLLPTNFDYEVEFDKRDLLDALNIISPINTTIIKMMFDANKLVTIDANYQAQEGSTNFELLNSNVDDTYVLALNSLFLISMLKNFDSDIVKMQFQKNNLSPVAFTNEDSYSLIMPCTIKE